MTRWLAIGPALLILLAVTGWWFLDAPLSALWALMLTQPLAFLALVLPGIRLARLAGPKVAVVDGFGAVCVSVLLFKLLPSRLSEGAKPLVLYLTANCPLARGVAAVVLERFLDIACVALFLALALLLRTPEGTAMTSALMAFLALIFLGGLVLVLVVRKPDMIAAIMNRLPFKALRNMAGELIASTCLIAQETSFAAALALSLATWMSAFAIFQVYFMMAGSVPLSFDQVLTVYLLSTLGLAVAVTPGGLGTYEAAITAGLALYGYPFDEALLSAVILRLANMAPALPVCFWYLSRHGLSLRGLLARVRQRNAQ